MKINKMLLAVAACFVLSMPVFAQSPATVNIDPFFAILDANKDGFIGRGEWKEFGLMDIAYPLCDPNKDDKITRQEMAACAVPESMDPKKESSRYIPGDDLSFHRPALQSPSLPMRLRESRRPRK